MSRQFKLTLAAAVACLMTLAVPFADSGPARTVVNLVDVNVATGTDGQPVITLVGDGAIDYESFVLDGPHRLVLDLDSVVSRLDRYRIPVGEGGVALVRAAQHTVEPTPVTRVVFDLEGPIQYTIDERGSRLAVAFGASGAAVDREDHRPAPVHSEPPLHVAATPEPVAVAETAEKAPDPAPSRAVEPDAIERLLKTPVLAAPPAPVQSSGADGFGTRTIVTDSVTYSGKRISLNLVDADIKQVFRLFHEISGFNFVLDPTVSGRVTIVLDQVPWDQALDLILKNNGLDKVLEGNVLRIAPTAKLAQEAAARKQLKEAEELEVEPITLTRQLSYARAADVENIVRDGGVLSPRGRVIIDERTNTLIVSDIPKKVEPLDALLSTLDAETPQVMIEARIVETSRTFTQDIGVDWGFSALADASRGTATGLAFPHNASVNYALNLPTDDASSLAFSFGNVLDSFTLDLALRALESEGRGRILSSPRVATQNNEKAQIEQGVRIPIVNTTATEIDVEFVSASLLLDVTPQITAEGTVILDVTVENNSPDFVNTAADIPSIRTQRAQTKVLINDGGTTVIGGIFFINEAHSELGVPWFRKIPIFGWLFRSQTVTSENRELLIFITPKIIRLS